MAKHKGDKGARDTRIPSVHAWVPVVIELPSFSNKWDQYRLTESDRTSMLGAILSNPDAWPVQRGMAGPRKARFASHSLDRGTSGGYRVFFAVFRGHGKIVLITLFPKNVQANLSRGAQNLISELVREIEAELEQIDREEKAQARKRRR
jgi:hypothetical protein